MGMVDVGFWVAVALVGCPMFVLGWVTRGRWETIRKDMAKRRLHPSRVTVEPYHLPRHMIDMGQVDW